MNLNIHTFPDITVKCHVLHQYIAQYNVNSLSTRSISFFFIKHIKQYLQECKYKDIYMSSRI